MSVSRETWEDLNFFSEFAIKWNSRINLFSKSTEEDLKRRHIEDSIQVYNLAPSFNHWVDLGSGGGFPGIVAAICAKGDKSKASFTLIEVDKRKATFLREISRILSLNVAVIAERIELTPPQQADIVSARALSSLDKLCGYVLRHGRPDGVSLFPKGISWSDEVEVAQKEWNFDFSVHQSQTSENAVILELKNIKNV